VNSTVAPGAPGVVTANGRASARLAVGDVSNTADLAV
jgi:hypothetical protein